jgi:galactonate dehydratase
MSGIVVQRRERLRLRLAPQAAVVAKSGSALDIADIRHFPLREPVSLRRYSMLRVETRSGLVGWGECSAERTGNVDILKRDWIGRPAYSYATISPQMPFRAALDMALLDIVGKAANAPVYRVLGGPTRNKVRAYGPSSGRAFPVAVIEVPEPLYRNQGKAYQNRLFELVNAVPEAHDFVLAGNGKLTPGDASSVATTLESKHPLWFDEPCSHSNAESLRKISAETVVPLGFGKGIDDPGVFQALLREGLIDLVRPEIGVFGIHGAKRVGALAEPYYVAVAPRHDGGPVGTAAAIQLAASLPNFFIQQVPSASDEKDQAMRREIVSPAVEDAKDGFLSVPKEPGLGIRVNESALEKYRAA